MKHKICLSLVLVLGCSAEGADGDTRLRTRLGSEAQPTTSWFAFDEQQRPVSFDSLTGAVIAQGPALPGVEKDLAFNPWSGRLAVFSSPEGDGGTVHLLDPSLAYEGPAFSIDGRVELWFGPDGLWLFEESYGERWRRIRHDEQWEPSWALPPPSSVWATNGSAFGALVSDDGDEDGGHAVWLTIDPTVAAIPQSALPLPGIVPSVGAVRATPLEDGVAIAWTVVGGILICTVDSDGAIVNERLVTLPGEVRQAATLHTPQGLWIALALRDTANPQASSTVVALDPYSETITPAHPLAGGLDGDHRVDRRMIAEGSRLIVATTAGLEALELALDPPMLTADSAFAGGQLRGPLERRPGTLLQGTGKSAL